MSSTASTIYTGFWINWSYGRVRGSTITLSERDSALLIAFIALFVRFAGGQLWSILVFLTSIIRATSDPQDALYHQQQAILRNTSQPTSVLWSMLKLSWFWRGAARKSHARTLPFVLSGLAYIAAFAVAGIFSSRISTNNSEVLLLPTGCGTWPIPLSTLFNPTKESWQDYFIQRTYYTTNGNQLLRQSHVYVFECYNSSLNHPAEFCLPQGKSRISWSTNLHAACPFDEDMCIADAIQLDTGFLNSHTHFGINSKNDHIEYRRVMTCAPIRTDDYVSGYVTPSELNTTYDPGYYEDETYLKYAYGPGFAFNDNTTFAYSNLSWGYSLGYYLPWRIYDIDVEFSSAVPDDRDSYNAPTFSAIPSLSRSDADTTLVFLSLNVSYTSEVRDPWFRSTILTTSADVLWNGTETYVDLYNPDQLTNVVACAEQHQLRNPTTGATTALGGMEITTPKQGHRLGFNDNQMAIFNRSFSLGGATSMTTIVPNLGGSYLLAAASSTGTESNGLPDNQWQLEFEHYFGVGLNTLQLWSQQYVTGPSYPFMNKYIIPATEDFAKEMCNSQITRRVDYRSFSVLGLGIVFAFGFIFTLINLTLTGIVEQAQKKSLKGRYRNAEWQANEFLQLQRMAYQHNNVGTWVGAHEMVPRTAPGEIFTLPQSTKWAEGVPESVQRDEKRLFRSRSRAVADEAGESRSPNGNEKGLFRSWSQALSHNTQSSQSPVPEISSGRSLNEQPVIHTTYTPSISSLNDEPVMSIANISSSSSHNNEPVVSTTDIEKSIRIFERQIKR